MISGYLDKRVTITTIQRVFDGRGGYINRETVLGEFWASIMPLSVQERTQYMQIDTSLTVKIYMRYNEQIQKGAKISYRGRKYEVKGILNPAFQDEYMELVVSEV